MKVSAIVVAGLLSFPFSNASAQSVNDAQIASIVVTANQVDIDAGELAKSRSTNKDVKAFAELMITDHTGVNKSAGHAAGQSNQPDPESRWRQEPRPSEDAKRRSVRQGVRRSRSRVADASCTALLHQVNYLRNVRRSLSPSPRTKNLGGGSHLWLRDGCALTDSPSMSASQRLRPGAARDPPRAGT